MENRFGDLIRKARKENGLTQKALGLLCGYDEKSAERVVQLWEAEKQPVPITKLRKLAEVLNLTLDDLIP